MAADPRHRSAADRASAADALEPPTQAALLSLWSGILDHPVGAHDAFISFANSLSALEYVNRVRERFNVDLPPAALLGAIPNVAKLAELIDGLAKRSSGA